VRVTSTVSIRRPVGDVFARVSDLNTYAQWAADVRHLAPDSEDIGAFVVHRQINGRRMEVRFKLVELVPDERIVLQGHSSGVPWRCTISFLASEEGTIVAEAIEMRLTGVARLGGPLFARVITRSVRKDLTGLQRWLEGVPATALAT